MCINKAGNTVLKYYTLTNVSVSLSSLKVYETCLCINELSIRTTKTLLVVLEFFTLNFLMAFSTQKYKNM